MYMKPRRSRVQYSGRLFTRLTKISVCSGAATPSKRLSRTKITPAQKTQRLGAELALEHAELAAESSAAQALEVHYQLARGLARVAGSLRVAGRLRVADRVSWGFRAGFW